MVTKPFPYEYTCIRIGRQRLDTLDVQADYYILD